MSGRFAAERPAGWLDSAAFFVFRTVLGVILRLLFRIRVENRPRLDGACVLVANHTSFLDPLLLGAVVPRRIIFLMTVLHHRSPWFGWFYRFSRAIPVAARGGANREALRVARLVLQRGEVLGVFPEGGIARDGLPMLGSPGAVSLVLAEDVPIVPVHIGGAHRAMPLGKLPRPTKVTVRFGAPIRVAELTAGAEQDRRARLRVATRRIMDRIAELGGHESREAFVERHRIATTA